MKHCITHCFVLLILTALSACTVGPQYQRVTPELPAAYAGETGHTDSKAAAETIDTRWWTALNDPVLNSLIDKAVADNLDLSILRSRVVEARAGLRGAQARFYPQVNGAAHGQQFRSSANGGTAPESLVQAGVIDIEDNLFEAGFDATWELDVFGHVRKRSERAGAQLGQAIETERSIRVSVIAEVARNYVELRGAQRRLAIARKNIQIQADTLNLVQNRYKTGLSPNIDVARAIAQLETTRAAVPNFQAAIKGYAHRVAVLTGQFPQAVLNELEVSNPIPQPPHLVPVGLPADLVWRRADVRAAERALAAATADVGIAVAELYPKFFLTGARGFENRDFSDLFQSLSRTWALGAQISWPAFRGGALHANIDASTARRDAAYAQFQSAVLHAVEEVETQLSRYAQEKLRRASLASANNASERAVSLANVLYEKGLDDFLTVLDAERTLTEIEDALVVSDTQVVLHAIGLFKSLGGGWEAFNS